MKRVSSGFTIIEVVLVLAIAGLIFMVVFLAIPGLQRSQRDTHRKSDLARFQAELEVFKGNNRGRIPMTQADIDSVKAALRSGGGAFNDPSSGQEYSVQILGDETTEAGMQCAAGLGSNDCTAIYDADGDGHVTMADIVTFAKASTGVATSKGIYYVLGGKCEDEGTISTELSGGGSGEYAAYVMLESGSMVCVGAS